VGLNKINPYNFIAIEGNIGAGKSTLAQLLSKEWNAQLILEEFEDNSFLPKFYEDSRRYAFPLEMSFLAARFNQLKKQLPSQDLFKQLIISDYIFAKCLLFSKVNLDEDDYELYHKLFHIINLQLPKPDLLVYLHCPIEKLQWNIANRGRSYEQHIANEYLQNLQETYFGYLYNQSELRILIIDCAQVDFLNNPAQYEQMQSLLCKEYPLGITQAKLL
jgi:deoxyadenosine/deoxycytidine kinase